MNTIELNDADCETISSALEYAEENAVTTRERLAIQDARSKFLNEWAE